MADYVVDTLVMVVSVPPTSGGLTMSSSPAYRADVGVCGALKVSVLLGPAILFSILLLLLVPSHVVV